MKTLHTNFGLTISLVCTLLHFLHNPNEMGKLISLDFEKGLKLNFSLKGIGLRISLADNCLFKHNLQLLEVLYNLFFFI